MKTSVLKAVLTAIIAVTIVTVLCTGSAQAVEIEWPAPNWPEIFEPNQLRTLNLEIDPADWETIRKDLTYDIEKPAWFWMTGEEDKKIVVAVRRKSDTGAMPNETDPNKISLKIDINQYYCDPCTEDCNLDPLYDPNAATDWHDLKKLSLENGDGRELPKFTVVTEGVAINLHRMAAGPEGYGYDNWYGNWVILNVNGVCRGVYVNQEQHDKQFLKNRNVYIHHETWLYKSGSTGDFELKVGDKESEDVGPKSPAVDALCYLPFACTTDPCLLPDGGVCDLPNDVKLAADMNEWVNMQGLLAMVAAGESFTTDGDAFFTHEGHNAYFLDFNLPDPCETRKRMYFRWDVDSALGVWDVDPCDWNIYENGGGGPSMNQEVILGHPTFRSQYNQIFRDLFDANGPLSFADINDFLDTIEPVLTPALVADPYSGLPTPGEAGVAQHFDEIRAWISERIPNVLAQVESDEPPLPPGIVLLDDGFDEILQGVVWDDNWDEIAHNWLKDTTIYAHGRPSAWAEFTDSGDFICDDLDASDATAIHVHFKFMKDDTDVGEDFILSYYNGTGYVDVCDLDTLGGDDVWLYYTDTITDSQYFVPNFRIRFGAPLERNEAVWVDDVILTKEAPLIISGNILDPGAAPVDDVLVDANNAGGADTTDLNGYYEVQVPFNWSGTVTPTKEDYTFEPGSRTYSAATADQVNQDYVGTSIYDLDPDGVIDFGDLAVMCENWLQTGPDIKGDIYKDDTVNFLDFAKFANKWLIK